MSKYSKSRLMATSAIAGLSILQAAAPAGAQEAFGIHNDQPETLEVVVAEDEEVEGDIIGVYADNGAVVVRNEGTIRGEGTDLGTPGQRPSGGIVIAQPGSSVTNGGTIIGGSNGITTSYFFGEDEEGEDLPPAPLAADTSVVNSGLIRGEAGSGVALTGGGSVENSGTIQGFTGNAGNNALGTGVSVSDFPDRIAAGAAPTGSISNSETGLIEGTVFGAVLQGGGTIDNAGIIRSIGFPNPQQTTAPFGVVMGGIAGQEERSATLNNEGTVSGFFGVLAGGAIGSVTINNDGLISAQQSGIVSTLFDGDVIINNGEDGQIVSNGPAILVSSGTLTLDNDGVILSNNGFGLSILTPDATIDNSGMIQGASFGITTNARSTPAGLEEIAANTSITNSGTIVGLNNDAIRLQGGGSVVNSGTIDGRQNVQSDGVSTFAFATQDLATYAASVTNSETGTITGVRAGVAHSSGGSVDNAGAINGGGAGVLLQNGLDGTPVSGSVTNSGTITGGNGGAGLGGEGVVVFGLFDEVSIANSGTISGAASDGIYVATTAETAITVENSADGSITGGSSGIQVDIGALELDNAGTIRGNGVGPNSSAPAGGIALTGSSSTIVNSGDISGAQFGIVTYAGRDPATGEFPGTIVDTTIVNSGTITGDTDDGVRLAGGGSVTNSGTIQGLAQNNNGTTDGVSIFAHNDQDLETYSATLINLDGGTIAGIRAGAAISGGGTILNDGTITGERQGAFIQGNAIDGVERDGQFGIVVNTGTISGTGDFGGTGQGGQGLGFGSNLEASTLTNSGTISSAFAEGVQQGSRGDLVITNEEGGLIEGGTSGIYGGSSGTLTVDNAGTIRGNGTYDGFAAAPDAGITIGTANSAVTNSGTISGAGAGITTAYLFDEEIGDLVLLAQGTQIVNSGTIIGETNDGVRLIGGGTVANSGTIIGEAGAFTDGVSMFRGNGQALETYSAVVTNAEGGEISGSRFGIILSEGGTVDNAGTITGNGPGAVLIQQGLAIPGQDVVNGSLNNSGTITGVNGYGAVISVGNNATLTNAGTITGAAEGAVIEAQGSNVEAERVGTIVNTGTITGGTLGAATAGFFDNATITNSGTISGGTDGVVLGNFGQATLINTGTITGGDRGVWGDDSGAVTLDNAGTIVGEGGVAVQLGSFDDNVILRTGSSIDGAVDAGDGFDTLTLDGDILELTDAQLLTESQGFEALNVARGYWSTSGFVGEFGGVAINEGAALQVNEIDLGEEGLSSPIATASVVNDGLLVLNFDSDDQLSDLDELTISGSGALQLIGGAVFTVDTDTLTYTGGTIVSNGGLVLSGTLLGDVTTEGDGFFQLGVGGTEGNFSGNIVNNGSFIFNRSDDYDFLGAFSGNGTLVKDGNSVLSFLGDYSFTGLTNILGGSVRIAGVINPETNFNLGAGQLDISGTDQTIGGLSGGGEASVVIDDSELTVDQDENTSFAGDITGTGSLVKTGDGTLNLTGTNSYTGPTSVNGGTLAVNGSIASDVTVNSGGKLGGNGSVGDTTVTNNGTLAPGNSIGRLTVNGDLALAAGSIYQVEVNAAGQGDRVDATGSVTIANTARVAVLAANGNYNPRTDYVILTGAAGVSGRFGSVTTDLAFLDPFLRYGSNAVTLSLYRNDIDFADVAVNFNQIGVANAVQALGIDNPLFEAVLVQNAATASAAFGDLSGEIHASTVSGLTDDSRHLRNALLDLKGPEEGGMFVWGSAFGGWGDFDGNAAQFGMDANHKGFVTGVGYGGKGFAAALSAGLGSSDFRFDGRGDSSDVESKYLAAHATYGTGEGIRAAFGVSYAWHDIDTSRTVTLAPIAQTLVSKRDGDTLQVFGELGYDIKAGKAAISPFLRLAHVDTDTDGVTETGGSGALLVGETGLKTTFLSLGARFQLNAGEGGFQPYASLAWNRAFDDRAAVFGAGFVAGGPAFGIIGAEIPKNSAEVEAGFEYDAGQFRIGAAYSGTLASDRNTHGARITARIAF
ncbi:autotransporter domain-containing protein [Sphingopyxis sp. KK2]|uniref:autotransporter domain-containing protein n=1 Tax=Sphingopyxis sp. KK2 TaxID=1855727 RepID=UPI00097E5DDE|nr:autotransporter domain-containing protein [Sphingopyxis sp. KK2]